MAQFSQVIAPGRFDATRAQFRAAWELFTSTPGVKLICGTEARHFAGLLEADGWDHFIGSGECYVAWATDTFERAWRGAGYADRIGTSFFRGGNHDARTPLGCVPLRHIDTGRLVMMRCCHTPAHVQAGDGFRKTTARVIEQGRAWVSALAVMGNRSRKFRRNHPESAEVIAADWNVDMHRAHWRHLISGALDLECATPIPDGGDLDKRLVSWPFYRGLGVASTAVGRLLDGFDHRYVTVHWTIKEHP